MLGEFVVENRAEIIARCSAKAALRASLSARAPGPGIPRFLDELVEVLHTRQPGAARVMASGTMHGADLLLRGLTVGQVVHDYGDVCQTITALAIERTMQIALEEFQLLHLCLDDAIASAVTEYGRQRELEIAADSRDQAIGDLGVLSYEVGSLLWSAEMAFDALKTGSVGTSGSTSLVLARSLASLRSLVERSFAILKLKGRHGTRERISVGRLIDVVQRSAMADAIAVGYRLSIEIHDASATFEADLQILAPIVAQLVRNAHHHSHENGSLVLRSLATPDRVQIEIEDECGGLPNGAVSTLFGQRGTEPPDRGGLRLRLGLSRRGVEAVGGRLLVRDLPGKGCVFVIDLPRAPSAR